MQLYILSAEAVRSTLHQRVLRFVHTRPRFEETLSTQRNDATHYGIVSGFDRVISASRKLGKVVETTVEQFADGQQVLVHGYRGQLSAATVIQRARSKLGEPYDVFKLNCERLVNWTHGFKPQSPQPVRALAIGWPLLKLLFS